MSMSMSKTFIGGAVCREFESVNSGLKPKFGINFGLSFGFSESVRFKTRFETGFYRHIYFLH